MLDEYKRIAQVLSEGQALIERERNTALKARTIIFLLPVIILIGTIGNIVNIILFSRKTFKSNSTFRFLLYLSIFDLLVLLICAPDAFLRFGYNIHLRQLSLYSCRLHTFFTYFFTHASSSILMLISIDRALIISNKTFHFALIRLKKFENIKNEPNSYSFGLSILCILQCGLTSNMKKNNRSFMHRTDIIMVFLLAVLAILNSHYILFMTISEPSLASNQSFVNKTTLFLPDANLTNEFYNKKLYTEQERNKSIFEVCFPLEGII